MSYIKYGRRWFITRHEAEKYNENGKKLYFDNGEMAYCFINNDGSFWRIDNELLTNNKIYEQYKMSISACSQCRLDIATFEIEHMIQKLNKLIINIKYVHEYEQLDSLTEYKNEIYKTVIPYYEILSYLRKNRFNVPIIQEEENYGIKNRVKAFLKKYN
jgi:hypothetical protein